MTRIVCFLFLFSLPAFASNSVRCTVSAASGVFKPFEGGDFIIDLKDGSSGLVMRDSKVLNLATVTKEKVSSLGLDRNTCDFKVVEQRGEDGNLTATRFTFEYCKYPDPANPKELRYLSVLQTFDMDENRGYYEELVFDGVSDSPFFVFKKCKLF